MTIEHPNLVDPADVDLDHPTRERAGRPLSEVMHRRFARRDFLKQITATGAAAAAVGPILLTAESAAASVGSPTLTSVTGGSLRFAPIAPTDVDDIVVADGYTANVVIRWGDSLDPAVPSMDSSTIIDGALLTEAEAAHQEGRFGYNNDAVEFFPLNLTGAEGPVCVNHEYTNDDLLFPGIGDAELYPLLDEAGNPVVDENGEAEWSLAAFLEANPSAVRFMQACHGISVVRVKKTANGWIYLKDHRLNRRIHANTMCSISGPAAGHELLQTDGDATGTRVFGTLNNCAAGATPWGTYLSAEENFDQYFGNADGMDPDSKAAAFHTRIPLPGGTSSRGWELVDDRFDAAANPNEAFRFGWVVEVDPMSRTAAPVKRTALGRFKHECATTIASKDGKAVVYSGDDARMEYMYKFVSAGTISGDKTTDMGLLDEGTLYVAKLEDDGTGSWMPLVHGDGPLTEANGFADQAEVLINARGAADLLGATPMDRPEDFEANPVTGKVYCCLTNNTRRTNGDPRDFQGREVATTASAGNPRAEGGNRWGHVLEITEADGMNSATTFDWEILMLCGDPNAEDGNFLTSLDDAELPLSVNDTYFAGFADPSQISPIGAPDNCSFDPAGNLWLVTDGGQPLGTNNGAFATELEGPNRGKVMQFLSGPVDSEVCGGEFTPRGETVFFAIQHPGDGGPVTEPTSSWPDGGSSQPRPSLVAVVKNDGGPIGS